MELDIPLKVNTVEMVYVGRTWSLMQNKKENEKKRLTTDSLFFLLFFFKSHAYTTLCVHFFSIE